MMWWKDSWGSRTVTGTPVISRRRALRLAFVGSVGAAAVLAGCGSDPASTPDSGTMTSRDDATSNGGVAVLIYASPTCGCCGDYADYLEAMGYPVDLRRIDQVEAIKADAGVPDVAASCHTAMIDDYVVEGHVPAVAIELLLEQRPAVDGIALPGMPPGSPGMGGTKAAPFEILSFTNGTVEPFTTL